MNTNAITPSHPPLVRRFLWGQQGFTMIELIIVLVVLGVLLAIGLPNLSGFIATTRVKNAAFDVHTSILAARNEAITRNATVTITPNGGTNWANGWVITASSGTVALKTQDALPGIAITGPATLAYNGAGRLTAAAGSISLSAPDSPTVQGRCINIDLSGRPATAKGVCP
ncbi:MAG: prepilin-type N-terminal cleavage/methylation domain-containing protein [Betaproteobacteria bacterium]|nr:prepilin-type N-terminal cleavage/methylation domain-containing protein [Betaproteobacteria bacterium]